MGSRQWGHPAISSLLRVKIYDFAMYMDGKQVIGLPHPCTQPQPISQTHKGTIEREPLDVWLYKTHVAMIHLD